MDAEETALLRPLRAELDRARAKIGELERAEAQLGAALQLRGADEFEREAQPARAGAARVAAGALAERQRARSAQPPAGFASQGLLQGVRLVSSDAEVLALLPRAVRAAAEATEHAADDGRARGAAATRALGAGERACAQDGDAERGLGRWRRRAAEAPPSPAPLAAKFPPIPLVPRKLGLAHHTAAAASTASALHAGGAGSTLGASHSPLLDAYEHYRSLGRGLPEPEQPRAQQTIQTPPARQLRTEAQMALALHELKAASGKLEFFYEWAAQHAPPAAADKPVMRGQRFGSDVEVEPAAGHNYRYASPGARRGGGGWRESMGEAYDEDGSSLDGGSALGRPDAYASSLLRKLQALEEAVASQPAAGRP